MWRNDQGTSSAVQPPQQARTHAPFRPHEEPSSMGEDAYLRNQDASSSHSGGSTAGLARRGAAPGVGGGAGGAAAARRGVPRRDTDSDAGVPEDDGMNSGYKAGMPIGLLAARGTPHAKKPIFKSRKFLILCPILGLVTLIVGIVLLVFPILKAVAKHTLSVSVLGVSSSNITNAGNDSFTLTLEGQVRKVGVFPAQIYFREPVYVHWIAPENLTQELQLGHFQLDRIGVAAGHGRIKQQTTFVIDDVPGFSRFAQYLITQDEFTWRLKSNNVEAKAFGFIPARNLAFVKDLTLPAMANMTDVSIADFQIPGDDPAGGLSISVVTKFTNPSAFGVGLGILSVDLYYGDLYLGPASTASETNLTAGVNTVHLVGRLVPYADDPTALEMLSQVFSNYLNGDATPVEARGARVALPGGNVVGWLTTGVSALVLNVPLKSPTGPIRPITGITIQQLSLAFDPSAPYAPQANSSAVSATFALPFGFSLNIVQLANKFAIVENRTAIASLSSPMGAANTRILVQNSGQTSGDISLELPLAPLEIGSSASEHLAFDQFTYDLTTGNGSAFYLLGSTDAVTDTPLGQVLLKNIAFTVPAGLIGLESLSKFPTLVRNVDVLGGTKDAILLNITVGLTNPSNLDLKVGNVTFQLFNNGSFVGTTVLPDLHLTPGYQEHGSIGYFQANNNPVALDTLNTFVAGTDNELQISGFNGSTATESLTQAFMALKLNTTLPGLQTRLLESAAVTILPTTGISSNLANAVVNLNNPFTSGLTVTNIQSNVTAYGIFVGSIVTDTNFAAAGKAVTQSPTLGLDMNLYPPDIFGLLRALAVTAGLPTEQLDGIVALAGYTLAPTTATASAKRSLDPEIEAFWKRTLGKRANIYTGFDLPSFVLAAFKVLVVDVVLAASTTIGEYVTDLSYTQKSVPALTDSSLTLLLPVLARPIVQKIVDEAILAITTVTISNPSNAAFSTGLVGAINNAGPFDAVIAFTTGLTVAWNGAPLGQIAMPNVSLTGDVGASLDLSATFAVADLNHLTDFTGYLLTEPSFTWQIYGQNLTVAALGIEVGGISIMKTVVLDGMNGFKNNVRIESFDLPANDPAGGVSLTLQTSLTNPSSVGVDLSSIGFINSFGSTIIGPAGATSAFSLTAKSTIQLPLAGRLIPQTTTQGLADVSSIFNAFIHGVPSDLVVAGDSAGPADCTWLNEGIKQLKIAVVLPAVADLQIIKAIDIRSLTLMFSQSDPWNPLFTTTDTQAGFGLPFAFPIDITYLATTITAKTAGGGSRLAKRDAGDFATLAVPSGPVKTNVDTREIALTFANVPFRSTDNSAFSSFLTQTTDSSQVQLGLHGSADTTASTAIGSLNLAGIDFDVTSPLLGLQGLNAQPTTVSDLDVFRGYTDYLQINVNARLYNPSNITIGTGSVAFGLQFQGQIVGTANIDNLVLVPGENVVATAVHYQPSGGAATAAGQRLLENYIQNVQSATVILGTDTTTPIASLQAALKTIALNTNIPALDQLLITQAALTFPINIGQPGVTANAKVTLANPFTASINIINVVTNASYDGIMLGAVNAENLNPRISAPGKTTIVSQNLPFTLNTDVKSLIRFVEAAAAANGVNLGPLLPQFAYVLGLSDTSTSVTSSVNPNPESCAPTGTTKAVQALILAAVANLKTDLAISALTALDQYQTGLDFVQNQVPTVLDDSVLYLTGILGAPIVANIVAQAELAFSSGEVDNITDNGFSVALKGSLTNAGPFDALISFPEGVQVIFQGNYIADIALPDICSPGTTNVPALETTGVLTIRDLNKFTDFATYLLLNPKFTWTIMTKKLRVYALQTIFDNVTLTKDITFSAFDGLPGVTIVNPDFPRDVPDGIALVTDTAIPSLSNLGVNLGTVNFKAYFEDQLVGPIQGNNLDLAPLTTTTTKLTGTIVKRTSQASTTSLGHLFSGFLAGLNQTLQVKGDSVVSPTQPNKPVNWLSAAFQQLTLQVVLPGKIFPDIISSITLQDLTVRITEQDEAYNVPSRNNETDVIYKNPFGFSLIAKQAGGSFLINWQGVQTALLTLPVADAVSVETSTGQPANLVIDFKQDRFIKSLDDASFRSFFDAVTNTASVTFGLNGAANVTAGTNAGDIPITGIPFNVQTSLRGIESLNARPTVVSDVVVYQGFPTYLQINADASLYNPSNVTVITNDVTFGLSFMDQIIGSVIIGDLLLIPGTNNIGTEVRYMPQTAAQVVAGMELLANFIEGNVSDVIIAGTSTTTPYGSLSEALGKIQIKTSIPPIYQNLITRADLSFPINIGDGNVSAQVTFDLSNPLRVSINLVGVVANASYMGVYLGQINQQPLPKVITADGFQNITSYKLPFNLNLDPRFLAKFVEFAAANNGVDLGILKPALDYVIGLSDAQLNTPAVTAITSKVNTGNETCAPTGTTKSVQATILKAVANLKTDLSVFSNTRLDEYATDLQFVQKNVPTYLDDSVLYLTGILGRPIVANIVDMTALTFTGGFINNLTDNGLTVALVGSLLKAGPFDALIEFPAGVDVIWEGQNIANIDLPSICSSGSIGVPALNTTGVLTITNYDGFVAFSVFLLNNPQFTWTITTNKLRVSALGTIFDNVTLTKNVTFDAFNKLSPGITLMNPDFPGDSLSPPGIKLTVDSIIPSPSNLGIELGNATFIASYNGSDIGPVSSSGLTLQAKQNRSEALVGTITYRNDAKGLVSLGDVFSLFLAGENVPLTVTGYSVISPAQKTPVTWLSEAFGKLVLTVQLPGKKQKIISAIQLRDLTVTVESAAQDYAAEVANNATDVTFRNPYNFTLTAIQAGGNFIVNYNGQAGTLNVPVGDVVTQGTSNGQDANITIQFRNPPAIFVANNTAAYQGFFAAVTNQAQVAFELTGGASVTARTKAGDIPISGIPVDVPSTFPGINGFDHKATIDQVPVVHDAGSAADPFSQIAGADFIRIGLTTILVNPAPLILHTNFASLQVYYRTVLVGRAYINPLDLYPGNNSVPAEFHYQVRVAHYLPQGAVLMRPSSSPHQPTDRSDPRAQDLLAQYLETTGPIPIQIEGDTSSSPYGSLKPALAELSLNSSFPGQGKPLVNKIIIYIDLVTAFCNKTVTIQIQLDNNLDTYIDLLQFAGTANQTGVEYASFDYTFSGSGFRTDKGGVGPFSEIISPVKLTSPLGLIGSIPLLFTTALGLDIDITTRTSVGGFVTPSLSYSQKAVPYEIKFSSAGASMPLPPTQTGVEQALGGLFNVLNLVAMCDPLGNLVAKTSVGGNLLSTAVAVIPSALQGVIGGFGGLLTGAATTTPSIATTTPSIATTTPSIATTTPSIATTTPGIATTTPSIATTTPSIATTTTAPALRKRTVEEDLAQQAVGEELNGIPPDLLAQFGFTLGEPIADIQQRLMDEYWIEKAKRERLATEHDED
ncbi:BQ2448_3568 [Microbotryum intermedium]|uniref:BQ2448_3568 protein n=1 Tax=Microbotryum intermedium TaxID=269621 RepID=A0A238FIA4_9BASI|nr:BQ2448_3568 [Microbotryum intermedium]